MDIEFESRDDPSCRKRLQDRTRSTIARNLVSRMNSKWPLELLLNMMLSRGYLNLFAAKNDYKRDQWIRFKDCLSIKYEQSHRHNI